MTLLIEAIDVMTWIGADKIDADAATVLAQVASDAVIDLIERDLSLQTVIDILDSNGTNYVLLTNWPVRAITSVSLNGAAVAPASFTTSITPGWQLDTVNARKLKFPGMGKIPTSPLSIVVVYSAGYDTTQPVGSPTGLPGAVWHALRLTASAIFNSQAADPNIASESTAGVFSGSFYASGVGAVPPGACTLLLSFMRTAP